MVVVVMRVTTLKATVDKLPGLLAYYAGLAEDREHPGPGRGPVDYYLDPDEPLGRWWGGGRPALGLDGPVAGDDLRALLEARHPNMDAPLGRRFGDSSARGFDATFSAPKSVSVLWALSPDAFVRAEVLAAHDAAVDAALNWFERHGAVTRRGTDGILQVDTRGVTVAVFRQHTSRTVDPQLHSHAIVSAKVQDDTGRWLALDARFLKYQQRTIGWIYDAALRSELTTRLGVGWIASGDGVLDLACVPASLRETFSSRTPQVEAKLVEMIRAWTHDHGGDEPDPRTIARLERAAVVASRPEKVQGIDGGELHIHWVAEARAAGFDPARLAPDQIRGEARRAEAVPDEVLIEAALVLAAEESASWLQADLTRHLTTLMVPEHAGSASELIAEVDRLATLAEQQCVLLGPEPDGATRRRLDGRPVTEAVTDRRLTTPAVLSQEQDLQAWAAANVRSVASSDDPQGTAAKALAGHDRLVLVVGPAGTGKTHTTAQAVADLQAQGRPVVGLAPSGKAADVLATAAACRTDTIAGFLTRHQDHRPSPWPAGTTVVLDEAGMAATDDLARLIELVRANQWRLVAVGDPEQLPSVARGGVFAHWCDTIPRHVLDEPRRFTESWEAAASLGLRAGRPDAVDSYAAHDRLHSAHPATAADQVASVWRAHIDAGRSVAVTTTNVDTARAINQEIQWQRHPTGRSARLHDGTRAFVGDEVATRRNDPRLRTTEGERVRNRHTWTVTAVDSNGGLAVEHPQRGSVDLPADYVAAHVELGWAVTGYGTQGDTVDIGIAVLDASANRNHTYVAMTRGRHANHAVLSDSTGLEDPAERLNQIITRPTSTESALAVQQRLHHAAGVEPPPAEKDASVASHGAPGTSEGEAASFEDQVEAMRRRLDAIQHRAPSPGAPGLSP